MISARRESGDESTPGTVCIIRIVYESFLSVYNKNKAVHIRKSSGMVSGVKSWHNDSVHVATHRL